jgi:hypothetical protein
LAATNIGSFDLLESISKDIFKMDSTFSVYNDLIIRIMVKVELLLDDGSERNSKRRNAHGSIKSSLAD